MEYNLKMQQVLNRVYRYGAQPICEQQIWQTKTLDGDVFYGIAVIANRIFDTVFYNCF